MEPFGGQNRKKLKTSPKIISSEISEEDDFYEDF